MAHRITIEDARRLRASHLALDGRTKLVARRAHDRQGYIARMLRLETDALRAQARAGTLYGRVIA